MKGAKISLADAKSLTTHSRVRLLLRERRNYLYFLS